MDVLYILFLIFGWFFNVKGLVITSLVLSSILIVLNIIASSTKDKESKKYKNALLGLLLGLTFFALAIIKLCIM